MSSMVALLGLNDNILYKFPWLVSSFVALLHETEREGLLLCLFESGRKSNGLEMLRLEELKDKTFIAIADDISCSNLTKYFNFSLSLGIVMRVL